MASMPALNLDAMQESDDEDARDTSAMMNMLLKIKAAKAKASESKKRKQSEQALEDSIAAFVSDVAEERSKTKKSCTRILGKAVKQTETLLASVLEMQQKQRKMQHERAAMLADLRRNSIEPLLARFEAMQAESGDLAERLPGQMTKETERTKAAVKLKLKELETALTAICSSKKEDKFTKLLKTLLSKED